jgi:flagellar L-ring protein precursor FlgH
MEDIHFSGLMRCTLAVCGPCMLGFCLSADAHAEALWKRQQPEQGLLFYDTQARRVGDLLTVVVREDSNVRNQDNRGLGKKTSAKGLFKLGAKSDGGFATQTSEGELDTELESNRSFDAKSSFRSQRAFDDRVTVTVIDVLPNGNLVFRGCRQIHIEGDQRTLVVTGIVRPFDVSADNTVNSRLVSDLHMNYEGHGGEEGFIRQGWLGRTANKVWPF